MKKIIFLLLAILIFTTGCSEKTNSTGEKVRLLSDFLIETKGGKAGSYIAVIAEGLNNQPIMEGDEFPPDTVIQGKHEIERAALAYAPIVAKEKYIWFKDGSKQDLDSYSLVSRPKEVWDEQDNFVILAFYEKGTEPRKTMEIVFLYIDKNLAKILKAENEKGL